MTYWRCGRGTCRCPPRGQVLVRMSVAGVNLLDETVRSGKLAPALHKPLPIRPGGFGVGRVEEPSATGLAAGDRVVLSGGRYGVSTDGSWADYIAVDAAHLVPIPDGVDDETAAALTTGAGYLTAYLALKELAGFRDGQSVLAPGVGGAVGQGGVEVARVLGASQAITTATTTEKAELGRSAGYEVSLPVCVLRPFTQQQRRLARRTVLRQRRKPARLPRPQAGTGRLRRVILAPPPAIGGRATGAPAGRAGLLAGCTVRSRTSGRRPR
ncbi:alcohol dehydrogenase catalytic domain-containing protein [Nonomuraea salmonea]|uniref:alcohol dehydrogenase catalytic domain-containing protein n=1 Tax=Nonomuraea salmonea TaxID=46181 RepID=UPI003CD0ACE9